jgi:peptidoglycan-N-acetylglucosamine deacetylase
VVAAAAAPTPAPVGAAALAPNTTTTTATTGSGGPFVAYRVQAGDTVRFIARTFGVSPASIANASGLINADQLRVGQVLTVPTQPGWLYRVQPGETLEQIAARTGVASEAIASASGLSVASVGPGTVILIPDQRAVQGK